MPRLDVTINVFLPRMLLGLGYVQAESYWAQPAPLPPLLRWQPSGAGKANWGLGQPAAPADWK